MRCIFRRAVFVIFLFSLIFPLLSSASDFPPGAVGRAAEEGLLLFIQKGNHPGARQHLGFSVQEDVDAAALGQGFRIYTIPPDRLAAAGDVRDLQSLSVATDLWDFLILKKGEAQAVLTIDLMKGVWTPVSIGASGLAKELGRLIETWPPSGGYDYRIIRIYQAKAEVAEVTKNGEIIGIVPLGSYLAATGGQPQRYSPQGLRSAQEVLTALRPVVRKNLELDMPVLK